MQTYVDINKAAQAKGEIGPITSLSILGLFDAPYLAETDYSYQMNGPYADYLPNCISRRKPSKKCTKCFRENNEKVPNCYIKNIRPYRGKYYFLWYGLF